MPHHKSNNSPYPLTPGDIHWLPKQDQLPPDLVTSLPHLEPGCFGHPIVILSTTNTTATATTSQTAQVCAITSLGGKPFEAYCHHKPRHTHHQHIPIHPAPPHPDTGQQLHLQASSRGLDKASYVKTGRIIVLPRAAIDCGKSARRGACRLDSLSLQELQHVVGLATGAPKKRKPLEPVAGNPIAPAVRRGLSENEDSAPSQYFVPGQWESVPLAAHMTEGQRGGYRTGLLSSTVRGVRDVEAADAAAAARVWSLPLAAHMTEGQRGGYRTMLPSSTVRGVRDVEAAGAAAARVWSLPLAAHMTEGQRGGYRTALPSSTVREVRDVEAADAAVRVWSIPREPRKPSRMAVQVLVIAACVFLVMFAVWYGTSGVGIGW